MPSSRAFKIANALLSLLVLRVGWSALGAFAGLGAFVGTCLVFPRIGHWLDHHDIELGSGAALPLTAVAWLACAALGTATFTRAWSLLLAAVTNAGNGRSSS